LERGGGGIRAWNAEGWIRSLERDSKGMRSLESGGDGIGNLERGGDGIRNLDRGGDDIKGLEKAGGDIKTWKVERKGTWTEKGYSIENVDRGGDGIRNLHSRGDDIRDLYKKIQNREEGSIRSGTGMKCVQHHDLGKRADRIKNKEGADGIRN
jgi:hypothetical protein